MSQVSNSELWVEEDKESSQPTWSKSQVREMAKYKSSLPKTNPKYSNKSKARPSQQELQTGPKIQAYSCQILFS
jgi:hypothetical protein